MSSSPTARTLPFPGYRSGGREQEAVRVSATRVQRDDAGGPQPPRRFSVDPTLTDLTVLRNLLRRAFELGGDFSLSYRVLDDFGAETYLPMVSDWDLSAAFLSASEPDLQLLVHPSSNTRPQDEDEDWDLVKSEELVAPIPNHYRVTAKREQNGAAQTNSGPTAPGAPAGTAGLLNTFNSLMRRALTTISDISITTSRPPLTDSEFRTYLDPARGVLTRQTELRYACYHGGVEPSLRRVVWKHLLNLYPRGIGGVERIEYMRVKCREYDALKAGWVEGPPTTPLSTIANMVRKDVLRTDRHLKYYAGDGNENVQKLFNILTTYALNHPSLGYCQGMSDLASPLLYVMGEEAQAYVCFCGLMQRVGKNFGQDGVAMEEKFSHLSATLSHYDPFYWAYLKSIGADDLLFCYRWLLLELKREFAFEDSLRMMEVLWASVAPQDEDGDGVRLWEVKYSPTTTPILSTPLPIPPSISTYSKVAAMRRGSSSAQELRLRRRSRQHQRSGGKSLDSSTSSYSVISTGEESTVTTARKACSLDQESTEVLSLEDVRLGSSPFEVLSIGDARKEAAAGPRLVKNLREFYSIGAPSGVSQEPRQESPPPPDSVFPDLDEAPPPAEVPETLQPPDYVDSDSGHCTNSIDNSLEFPLQTPSKPPPQQELPPPNSLGGGNPFLIFLSLTLLLQHRDVILRNKYDYNETAIHFDRLVRRHNLNRVLGGARQMYDEYYRRGKGGGRGQERC